MVVLRLLDNSRLKRHRQIYNFERKQKKNIGTKEMGRQKKRFGRKQKRERERENYVFMHKSSLGMLEMLVSCSKSISMWNGNHPIVCFGWLAAMPWFRGFVDWTSFFIRISLQLKCETHHMDARAHLQLLCAFTFASIALLDPL